MTTAYQFNRAEMKAGRLTPLHVETLLARYGKIAAWNPIHVATFQRENGLVADGKAGPATRAVLELLAGKLPGSPEDGLPELIVDRHGWLSGEGVTVIPMHASWRYSRLKSDGSVPLAIVAHYSATPHGTAVNMANRRKVARDTQPTEVDGDPEDRAASWHFSIEGDGSIVQMASCMVGTWHAGGPSAKPIPGVGAANRYAVGIELIGDGSAFPEPQVAAACRLWRALVAAYRIPKALAMVGHSELDPTRKRDPGALWTASHAPRVLAAAGF